MISPEVRAEIRRYFYAEHWKIGTIARELNLHPDTVRIAVETQRLGGGQPVRPSKVDPYLGFIRETLEQHPRLRATRIYHMIRDRGYSGSVVQLRRAVTRLRPQIREPFLRLDAFAGEQAQVDWAHFGQVIVGRARRALSCFLMTLSWSRALYLEFFFDQTTENFLRGHVHAFEAWNGQPRVLLYDNLKSAVLERRGGHVLFNPAWSNSARTITSLPAPVRCAPAIRKDAWNGPFAMCAIRSGPDGALRLSPNATTRHGIGVTRLLISAAGREKTAARWLRSSSRNSRASCRLPCIRSARTALRLFVRARRSMSAST
jgi:hypothetical protein